MTTPQDIQEALEHFNCAINTKSHITSWKCVETIRHVLQSHAPTQNVALDALNRFRGLCRCQPDKPQPCGHCVDMDTIRGFIQSHAPEARPVDAEALKKGNHNVNNPLYRDYNIGWNACIDELLRRGFRQGGGV